MFFAPLFENTQMHCRKKKLLLGLFDKDFFATFCETFLSPYETYYRLAADNHVSLHSKKLK